MKKTIFFIAAILMLLYSCNSQQNSRTGASYKTLTVSLGNRTLESNYSGAVRGCQSVEVRPQVSGTITEIKINEGDAVRKGQVLFVIDQVPYKAALETAKANVKSAEAQVGTARLTADSKKQLFEENVVSEFDLQTSLNALNEAEANLAYAKAQELNARNNLSYTEVKSPVDGVASMIPYRVGALVDSNIAEPLVTVSDDNIVYVYFSMNESQILDLTMQYGSTHNFMEHMTDSVGLILNNGSRYALKGSIDAISGTIDESTGAVSLRASFENPDHLLRHGGNATVVLPTVKEDCIVIPQAATYELQNRVFVYKVVDGKAQSAPIEVFGLNDGNEYIVVSGLVPGDVIIAEGAGLVKEGTEINTDVKE